MPASFCISAENLGAVALPGFCPRCFWIQMHAEGLPYQIFPGIFSSIDSYGKRLVHAWFDRHQSAPPWLAGLGDIKGYRPPPHFSKFSTLDRETGIVLRGTPDGILVRRDDSHVIVDYKTAKFTARQDELFPMYDAQLNAYAFIGEQCGFSPVSGLALVYTEPVTDNAAAAKDGNLTEAGFVMDFSAHVLPVDLAPQRISKLLAKVREIYHRKRPPESRQGCKDCALLKNLIAVVSK
ncbi:MAG: PD-(D/E)XK nuclease family protein [Acidobacteriia bacterium]|nr:PD-(D/E)XK nuclease family protein [Terriglobia bacterium]